MGIPNLLKFLTNSSRDAHISEFENQFVAIDAYCWLHKGIYCCSVELAMKKPTTKYVTYCMRYIEMLLHFKVKPILVFDGRVLSSKLDTEKKRREERLKKYNKGIELIRAGKIADGRKLLGESVDVTHELVINLMKECRELNIDCIVAPHEADAQLAFFSLRNIVKCIITEDSDLLVYGCEQVMFKMDTSGLGKLVEKSKLHLSLGINADEFSEDKFRYMCILSGCDYLPSLTSIGVANALKFIKMLDDKDIYETLPMLPIYLNKMKVKVTPDYKLGFKIADSTFKFQLVYDPFERKQVPLRSGCNEDEIVGEKLPDDVAFQLAIGNIDPNTMKKLDDFDPDKLGTGFNILWKQDKLPNASSSNLLGNFNSTLNKAKKRQPEVFSFSKDLKKVRLPHNTLNSKTVTKKPLVKVPQTGFVFEPKVSQSKKDSKPEEKSKKFISRYFSLEKFVGENKPVHHLSVQSKSDKLKDESNEDYLRRLYEEFFPAKENEVSQEIKENSFCCERLNDLTQSETSDDLCLTCSKCSKCCCCSSKSYKEVGATNNKINKIKKENYVQHFLLDEIYKDVNKEAEKVKETIEENSESTLLKDDKEISSVHFEVKKEFEDLTDLALSKFNIDHNNSSDFSDKNSNATYDEKISTRKLVYDSFTDLEDEKFQIECTDSKIYECKNKNLICDNTGDVKKNILKNKSSGKEYSEFPTQNLVFDSSSDVTNEEFNLELFEKENPENVKNFVCDNSQEDKDCSFDNEDFIDVDKTNGNIDLSARVPSPVFKIQRDNRILNKSKIGNVFNTAGTPTSVYFSSGAFTQQSQTMLKQTPLVSNKKSTSKLSGSAPSKSNKNLGKGSTVHRTLFQFGFKKALKEETM